MLELTQTCRRLCRVAPTPLCLPGAACTMTAFLSSILFGFFFTSHLYTQHGARTHKPNFKSHMFYQRRRPSAPPASSCARCRADKKEHLSPRAGPPAQPPLSENTQACNRFSSEAKRLRRGNTVGPRRAIPSGHDSPILNGHPLCGLYAPVSLGT